MENKLTVKESAVFSGVDEKTIRRFVKKIEDEQVSNLVSGNVQSMSNLVYRDPSTKQIYIDKATLIEKFGAHPPTMSNPVQPVVQPKVHIYEQNVLDKSNQNEEMSKLRLDLEEERESHKQTKDILKMISGAVQGLQQSNKKMEDTLLRLVEKNEVRTEEGSQQNQI